MPWLSYAFEALVDFCQHQQWLTFVFQLLTSGLSLIAILLALGIDFGVWISALIQLVLFPITWSAKVLGWDTRAVDEGRSTLDIYIYESLNGLSTVLRKLMHHFGWVSTVDEVDLYDSLFTSNQQSELYKKQLDDVVSDSIGPSNVEDGAYCYGLVNVGNSCFLNSVLQALSPLGSLHTFLHDLIDEHGERPDAKSGSESSAPVSIALYRTLRLLHKPTRYPTSIRPHALIHALQRKPVTFDAINIPTDRHLHERRRQLFISREQQDAQELFQTLSEAVTAELAYAKALSKSATTDQAGLKWLLQPDAKKHTIQSKSVNLNDTQGSSSQEKTSTNNFARNPLVGLLASRLSCVKCGYTEAIRHFTFDNLQLTLPLTSTCSLQGCLRQFVQLEHLSDAHCRRCSLRTTLQSTLREVEALKEETIMLEKCMSYSGLEEDVSNSNGAKLIEVRARSKQFENNAREIVYRLQRNIEEPLPSSIQIVHARNSHLTKQTMLASPPQVLCLHIARTTIHPDGSGRIFKNSSQLLFEEWLDITPIVTGPHMFMNALEPISALSNDISQKGARYRYRLMSIVVHQGSHNFGHYLAYRRRNVFSDDDWVRASDERVETSSLSEALDQNPYLLFYERYQQPDSVASKSSSTLQPSEASSIPEQPVQDRPVYHLPAFLTADEHLSEAERIANSLLRADAILNTHNHPHLGQVPILHTALSGSDVESEIDVSEDHTRHTSGSSRSTTATTVSVSTTSSVTSTDDEGQAAIDVECEHLHTTPVQVSAF